MTEVLNLEHPLLDPFPSRMALARDAARRRPTFVPHPLPRYGAGRGDSSKRQWEGKRCRRRPSDQYLVESLSSDWLSRGATLTVAFWVHVTASREFWDGKSVEGQLVSDFSHPPHPQRQTTVLALPLASLKHLSHSISYNPPSQSPLRSG